MEDIIAIKVTQKNKNISYFLTWGRISGALNEDFYFEALKNKLGKSGVLHITEMKICDSLQEASKKKYFFESYFLMNQMKIPFGKNYKLWQQKMMKKINEGYEIYSLGGE